MPFKPPTLCNSNRAIAIALCRDNSIRGIHRDKEHKVLLFADDLLILVSVPMSCIPKILKLLKHFGLFSGYKLNIHKSELLPINAASEQCSLDSLPFKVSPKKFTYLGVVVTRQYADLFIYNFWPLLGRTKLALERWSGLPLSLAGCINAVKVPILPKFLYLFQSVPVYIKKCFFSSLDQLMASFIWNSKPPRIRKTILQRPR